MKSEEVRRSFLEFYADRGHTIVASDSLVPENDPSLLFTGAGMNQFKAMFLGIGDADYTRATTSQKCMRMPDLENVGVTAYHHTFFEMLGNFSFGDYFKEEAIAWAWEYLTEILKLPVEKLAFTVYEDDDEAFDLWRKMGVPAERIFRYGESENFWPANAPSQGPNGVCGPCSEMFYDWGPESSSVAKGEESGPANDGGRYWEIGNLVFTQFDRKEGGKLDPLPSKNIDTGWGLERLSAVMQGKRTNFESDLFAPIIAVESEISGVAYGKDPQSDIRLRRIADHVRASIFCITDGVLPSNEERGYVLRKIMRRAIRDGWKLGIEDEFLHKLVHVVGEVMKPAYPEVLENEERIARILNQEERRFRETFSRGQIVLDEMIEAMLEKGEKVLPGDQAFMLYDTHGFPIDLAEVALAERGLSVDMPGFEKAMEEQRERARAHSGFSKDIFAAGPITDLKGKVPPSVFTGYDHLEDSAKILAIVEGEKAIGSAGSGRDVLVVLDRTPFYAEGGGQVGDRGRLEGEGFAIEITDTVRKEDFILHCGRVQAGEAKVGAGVKAVVDIERRSATMRNHTATHLLHKALKEVLGDTVDQAGSYVGPDRLRFDFSHDKAVTRDELREIERIVNQRIFSNRDVNKSEMTFDAARQSGAVALFGEKYGDSVRVVDVDGWSRELCGGTHVERAGDIGPFVITTETSVAAGVRRIEAVTGWAGVQRFQAWHESLQESAAALRVGEEQVPERISAMQDELKKLRSEIKQVRKQAAQTKDADLESEDIGGISVIVTQLEGYTAEELRATLDRLKASKGAVAAFLASPSDGQVAIAAGVSAEAIRKGLKAGDLVKTAATHLGGGGGGRPDFAQGRGKDVSKLSAALDAVKAQVRETVS
ncbi:MAG: alanine--tRNA ligase [Planctomycetota bacterium]